MKRNWANAAMTAAFGIALAATPMALHFLPSPKATYRQPAATADSMISQVIVGKWRKSEVGGPDCAPDIKGSNRIVMEYSSDGTFLSQVFAYADSECRNLSKILLARGTYRLGSFSGKREAVPYMAKTITGRQQIQLEPRQDSGRYKPTEECWIKAPEASRHFGGARALLCFELAAPASVDLIGESLYMELKLEGDKLYQVRQFGEPASPGAEKPNFVSQTHFESEQAFVDGAKAEIAKGGDRPWLYVLTRE